MVMDKRQVRQLAILARRSLSTVCRKLTIAKNMQQPEWATETHARDLLAPLLVSTWDDSCKSDRDALAQLSGLPYEYLQTVLIRSTTASSPPIRRVGDIWEIADPADTWRLIACYLTDEELQRFETVAINILGNLDAASIYGKVPDCSRHLRRGIAETIALMATLSCEVPFVANTTGEDIARGIVSQLMEKAKNNETLWTSLADLLPLVAEAAPSVFLAAVDADLSGERSVLVCLFQDHNSDISVGSSLYVGLIQALETLAWSPDCLSRAALTLARLARLDSGDRLVNRPARSLENIFDCWHPATAASLQSRLAVLDTIRHREPDIAWNLMMNLLPKHRRAVSENHKTRWRNWLPDSQANTTEQKYIQAKIAILNRLIAAAETHSTRWCNLISTMIDMLIEQQAVLLQKLDVLDPKQFSSEERAEICNVLRHEFMRHQNRSHTDGTMPTDHVQRLKDIYTRFELVELAQANWQLNVSVFCKEVC
jgi:hypothetical protein